MRANVHSLPPPVRSAEEIEQRRYLEDLTGLQGRLLECQLANFRAVTPKQKQALRVSRQYVDGFDEQGHRGGGLLYIGTCGTGKSTLAAGVTIGVAMEKCYEVMFTTIPRLLRRLHDAERRRRKPTDDEDDVITLDEVIEHYGRFLDLLVLDDVTADVGTGNDLALLDEVINLRSVHRRPVVLTSNLTRPELRAALGDRMYDRAMEGTQVIVLDGPSLRTGME